MLARNRNDCGLRIADCGLGYAFRFFNPKSEIRNPKSKRSAISLTEVLIAMGIMTVGLLGVASVFPVGSWYAQKALVADQGSAIAQSVMNDLLTRGMLNPDAWMVMTPVPSPQSLAPTVPNYSFGAVDGKYCPVNGPLSGTFTRPYAETLAAGLKQNSPDKLPANKVILAKQFGHAIVIDPMFVSSATRNLTTSANIAAYGFPAAACMSYPWTSSPTYYKAAGWDPWRAAGGKSLTGDKTWPIRRATFSMSNGWPLDKSAAEGISRGTDDLAYDFPDRDDRPSMQTWDTANVNGNQMPMARKWTGDYSWIASVVPTTNTARDGMARNPQGFAYEVSVVVFHKRPLPAAPPATGSATDLAAAALNERSVTAAILSTGLNGGELLLKDQGDNSGQSPFDNLKSGQWIMLCGPHPNSSTVEPRFSLNWYQIKAIDKSGAGIQNFDPNYYRVVTVRGPQWPWQPAANLQDTTALSNDLCVGICRGAVAVHTKTIRLESPLGSSYGTGMSVITPPGVSQLPYR